MSSRKRIPFWKRAIEAKTVGGGRDKHKMDEGEVKSAVERDRGKSYQLRKTGYRSCERKKNEEERVPSLLQPVMYIFGKQRLIP